MLVRAKKIVAMGVMTLVAAVISLPVVSIAATSPTVAALSPITQGLRSPVKMALDVSGNIYVADQRAGGVVLYDTYGVQKGLIRTSAKPGAVAVAQDGSLLVAQAPFVVRYDVATGQEVGRFGDAQLVSPAGIAVDNVTGYIYVTDNSKNQVVVFTASGALAKVFATGQLSSPAGITFEKVSRQFAVADMLNNRVQLFDVDGNLVKSVGRAIAKSTTQILAAAQILGAMQFEAPVAVAFEYSKDQVSVLNRMYVVDTFQGNVQVVDLAAASAVNVSGTTKNYIGYSGIVGGVATVTPVGSAKLMVPSDVLFDSVNGRLLVVNGWGNVTIYGIDGGVNPVNTTPPVVEPPAPVVLPVALTVAATPAITASARVTLTGTVDAGATVTVANVAATVVGTVWSCDVALVEGVNSISVLAQKAQNKDTVATVSITLDTVAPSLTVSALQNNSYTSTQVQGISGTVSDSNGVAAVTVNGVAAVLNGNAFSVPVTLLNNANQIVVAAVDAAGNIATDTRTIYFDAAKPVITVLDLVDNSFTSVASQKISGSVDKVATVKVAGVPAVVDGTNWSATVALAAGVNTIDIAATDLYGNSSSLKRTVTLDSAKPELSIAAPSQDVAVNVPNVLISGTVSDSTAVTLEYSLNGVVSTVPVNAGVFSFNVDFAAEGNYPVMITAKDSAGNTATAVRNVIYDKTPPLFTLNNASGVMPEKISGTVESGSSVVVKDGTAVVGSVSYAGGTWSADLTGVNYTPENLVAVATDAAGNSTSKTLSYSFPDGTLGGGAKPTVQDALRAIRIVVNNATPSAVELAHYDIGPLVGGKPNPNGKIEIVDAILILRKALGLTSW